MLPANKMLIGLFINYTLLSGNVSGKAVEVNKHASDAFSPRQYCLNTGGAINETAHANQYICCYKHKCLLIDTEKGKSIILEKNNEIGTNKANPSEMWRTNYPTTFTQFKSSLTVYSSFQRRFPANIPCT